MSQFFFAWVDAGDDAFAESAHAIEDEEVIGFVVSQTEGDFATLQINIKNPRVGLLASGRKRWAWLAWDGGSAGIEPLFFGRLVGIPTDFQANAVTLQFIARPQDFETQKEAVAAALRVSPFYDPLWIQQEERDNPDTVLEGYSRFWHIDRLSHVVSTSDIATGEDGSLSFSAGQVLRASVTTRPEQPPARRAEVEASVDWSQRGAGEIDLTDKILSAFSDAGTLNPNLISTYTGEGLLNSWPDPGRSIGAGWFVGTSEIERVDRIATIGITFDTKHLPFLAPNELIDQIIANENFRVSFPLWEFDISFGVSYKADRSRGEVVRFTLEADTQALVTEPGDAETIKINLASNQAGEPIDPGGLLPIRDERRKQFFTTDRGIEAIHYLIAVARARLLFRARAVVVEFAVPFELATGLTCRKNATVTDPRLPGGTASGKVIAYRLECDGDTGLLQCVVSIGCMIGQGNTVAAAAGTPDYVEDGYVEAGYQTRTGETVEPISGEVTLSTSFLSIQPSDDGLNLLNLVADDIIEDLTVNGGVTDQELILANFFPDLQATIESLNQIFTEVCVDLVSLEGGPFETIYDVTVSDLMVPKTIDLEAS